MKRRRESTLERWAMRWARARGIVVSKLTDPTGIMDHVFWLPGGRPLLVEFKDPDGVLEPLQEYYLSRFKQSGYRTARIDTKEKFLTLMEELWSGDKLKTKK